MIFKCFSGAFFASVSEVCFKCFICLQTYVASVASRCFKSKSGVASPSSHFCCLPQCLLLRAPAGHLSPLLLFPMLVTFRVARETYTGSGCEGRRRSSRGMRVPKAEALGCLDREVRRGSAGSYVRADTHKWSNRHRRLDADIRPNVWMLVRRFII
jgi:hypothetical protein